MGCWSGAAGWVDRLGVDTGGAARSGCGLVCEWRGRCRLRFGSSGVGAVIRYSVCVSGCGGRRAGPGAGAGRAGWAGDVDGSRVTRHGRGWRAVEWPWRSPAPEVGSWEMTRWNAVCGAGRTRDWPGAAGRGGRGRGSSVEGAGQAGQRAGGLRARGGSAARDDPHPGRGVARARNLSFSNPFSRRGEHPGCYFYILAPASSMPSTDFVPPVCAHGHGPTPHTSLDGARSDR